MRKIMSVCLSVFLILSTLPFVVEAAEWTGTGAENVTFSFGVIGDTHTDKDENTVDESVQAAIDLGAQFIAFHGDVITVPSGDDTTVDYYAPYYEAFSSTMDKLETAGIEHISAMGNHEFAGANATTEIAREANETYMGHLNAHIVSEQGFHFISGSPESYNNNFSTETVDYMIAEVEKAIAEDSTNDVDGVFADGVVPNSTKPVFVVVHYKTASLSRLVNYLKTRPQAVLIYGHAHPLAERPLNIAQNGFTEYLCPVSYGNASLPYVYISPEQGTFIQVENDSVVKIYKTDLNGKTFIGEPWTIDIGAIVADLSDEDETNDTDNFLYSSDKRENPSVPYFNSSAAVTVEPVFTAAKIMFPKAYNDGTENQQDDFVWSYDVRVYDSEDSQVYQTTIYPDYVNNKTVPSTYSTTATGLAPGQSYTAKIYAVSPLSSSVKSEPITATFKTATEECPTSGTRYEFEDYIDAALNGNTPDVASHSAASGGELVDADIRGTTDLTVKYSDEFTITAATAGEYNISYAIGRPETTLASNVSIYIDGTLLGSNDSSYATDLSANKYPGDATLMSLYKPAAVELTEGEHTVKVEVSAATGYTTFARYRFSLDYLQIEPVKTQEVIVSDGKTTVEFDDWGSHLSGVEIVELYGASESKLLLESYGTGSYEFTIPFTIEETGTYVVEYVMGVGTRNIYGSYIDFTFETNGKIGDNYSKSGTDIGYTAWPSYQTLRKFTNIVDLTEGTDTLTVTIPTCNGQRSFYQLDYISFVPSGLPIEVSNDEATRIEIEDYAGQGANGSGTANATSASGVSAGGYLSALPKATTDALTFEIDIPEDGTYSVRYGSGYYGSYAEKHQLRVDDTIVANNYTSSYRIGSSYATEVSGYPLYVTGSAVSLTKGEHTIAIDTISGNGYMWIDYVEIERLDKIIDVQTTEPTRIELENYAKMGANSSGTANTTTISGVSGGGYLSGLTKATTDVLSFDINIPVAGMYKLSYGAGSPGSVAEKHQLRVDDDTIVANNYTSSYRIGSSYATITSGYPLYQCGSSVELIAGTHTITIDTISGNGYMWLDYVEIEYLDNPVEISLAEETVVEFEDYAKMGANSSGTANTTTISGVSGGGYLSGLTKATTDVLSFDINIPVAGMYTLSYGAGSPGSVAEKHQLRVDDTIVANNYTSSYRIGSSYATITTGYPMYECGSSVKLTAGTHTITIDTISGNGYMWLDYFKAEYVKPIAVSETEATRIEYEQFAGQDIAGTSKSVTATDAGVSGGAYLDGLTSGTNTGVLSFDITIPVDGKYVFRHAANRGQSKTGYDVGRTIVNIDGLAVVSNGKGDILGTEGSAYAWSNDSSYDMRVHTSAIYELLAGDYTISIDTEDLKLRFLDYLEIERTDKPYVVSLASSTKVEFEDFAGQGANNSGTANTTTISGVSGGGYLSALSKATTEALTFEIDVPKTGKYSVRYGSGYSSTYAEKHQLRVDDTIVANNYTSSYRIGSSYATITSGYPLYVTGSTLTLTEGIHTITVDTISGNGYMWLDYFEIVPVSYVTYDADAESVATYIAVDTLGDAVIALYDADNKLCGLYTDTITEAKIIETDISCSNTPASCRVFAWESVESVNPLTESRNITIE